MKKASIEQKAFSVVKVMDLRKIHQQPSDASQWAESVWMRLNDKDMTQRFVRLNRKHHVKLTVWSDDEMAVMSQVVKTEANSYSVNLWVLEPTEENVSDLKAIAKMLSNNYDVMHNDYMAMVETAKRGDHHDA